MKTSVDAPADFPPGTIENRNTHEAIWWRQLVEQSRDGIVVIDDHGQVFWVNEKFATMLGYTREKAFELGVWDWDSQIPVDQLAEMLRAVDVSGAHFETQHRRKDGSTYDVEICTNAVTFGEQKLVLCVCRDITERRQAEQALQEAFIAAKDLAAQLARQQDMLVQSEKLASLGQLAAGVAHEINNPLSFVRSNYDCLGDYVEDLARVLKAARSLLDLPAGSPAQEVAAAVDELRAVVEDVDAEYVIDDALQLIVESKEGAERIKEIVENMRGFVRADEKEPSLTAVRTMIDAALLVTQNEVKYHCEVDCRVPDDLPLICCYPRQIEQVLMNLLVNAAQAIEDRGTISIEVATLGDDRIGITVRDDGAGIPEDRLHRIFDPFFTTKEVGKGTGLGLHISHAIVERHGGHISVASQVGQGTRFTIELPLQVPVVDG